MKQPATSVTGWRYRLTALVPTRRSACAPAVVLRYGSPRVGVAQLVERWSPKPEAAGWSPAALANRKALAVPQLRHTFVLSSIIALVGQLLERGAREGFAVRWTGTE